MGTVVNRHYDIKFSFFAPFVKAYEKDGNYYLVVKASDTSVDRDNEQIAPELIDKMRRLAKEGKLVLLDHHRATFPMGVSVGVENEGDPSAFYPVFKLDPDHPYSMYLFQKIQSNAADFGVSIGGKFPKVRWTYDETTGKTVAQVYDAEIDHVAFTRRGYEANPNTGIVRAIIKELQSVGLWEKEMEIIQHVTRVHVDEASDAQQNRDKHTDNDERKQRSDEFRISEEALNKAVSAVLASLGNREVTTEQFAKEFAQAVTEAKIRRPEDNVIFEREQSYGYKRGVYASAIKPSVWQPVPDYLFADPVSYFYPTSDEYFKASYTHFVSYGWKQYYTPDAAVKVFENFVRRGLEVNPDGVSFTDNLLLASQLPVDLKVKLKDYNPLADTTAREVFSLWQREHEYLYTLPNLNWLKEIGDNSELIKALREREQRYGYTAPVGANLIVPPCWANLTPDQFADPVGLKFPIHTPEATYFSLHYFSKEDNRTVYSTTAQLIVLKNILKACARFGVKAEFRTNDPLYWLLPAEIKKKLVGYNEVADEDTEELREKMAQQLQEITKQSAKLYATWLKETLVTVVDNLPRADEVAPTVVGHLLSRVSIPTREIPMTAPVSPTTPTNESSEEPEFYFQFPVKRLGVTDVTLSEITRRVGELGVKFNVIHYDPVKGQAVLKSDDAKEIIVKVAEGVLEVRGVLRDVAWALDQVIADQVAERLKVTPSDVMVVALRPDMAVVRVFSPTGSSESKLYVVGWRVGETGDIVISPNLIEAVEAYAPPDMNSLVIHTLNQKLWV